MGYLNRGAMTKWGWAHITTQYYARTGLVHDNVVFGHKVRDLKREWTNIQTMLLKSTGLGRKRDGSASGPVMLLLVSPSKLTNYVCSSWYDELFFAGPSSTEGWVA